jgi:tetratricopeptide (TPR) repeat protein
MDEKIKQWASIGREHYEKREYTKAEAFLTKVLKHSDAFADVHNMMGVIHHDRGRLELAKEAFERALALNPRYTEAALNLVVTYNDLKRYEDAQRVYQQVLTFASSADTIEPYARGKIANLHAEVAQAYFDVGMYNEASQEYRRAINLCPDFADLRLKLANVYRQWGEPVAAKLELEEAVRIKPSYVSARISLGVLQMMLGHVKEAVEQWNEVVQREPDNKAALMYLRMAENPTILKNSSDPRHE